MEDSYHGRYDDLVERFGSPWYFVHRVDLHSELKQLAQDLGVDIQLATEIINVNVDTGELCSASGQIYQKDLIVAADGVHVRLFPTRT